MKHRRKQLLSRRKEANTELYLWLQEEMGRKVK